MHGKYRSKNKKPPDYQRVIFRFGGEDGTRTHDLLTASQAL